MPNHPSPNEPIFGLSQADSGEISLLDILYFLKKAWMVIFVMGGLGLLASIVYLLVIPARYEAVANIQMARVAASGNPLGVSVEEPVALIARMSVPTSLNEASLTACDLKEVDNLSTQLDKAIKLSIPKGIASVVELKVIRTTPELAKACARAVFEAVAQSQSQKIEETSQSVKEKSKTRLAKIQERLAQDQKLLTRLEQTKGAASAISPAYFALLSESRALEDERERLQELLESPVFQATQLQSPIYAADNSVYPKRGAALAAGLFGGLFLGLLWALGYKIITDVRAQLASLGVGK